MLSCVINVAAGMMFLMSPEATIGIPLTSVWWAEPLRPLQQKEKIHTRVSVRLDWGNTLRFDLSMRHEEFTKIVEKCEKR